MSNARRWRLLIVTGTIGLLAGLFLITPAPVRSELPPPVLWGDPDPWPAAGVQKLQFSPSDANPIGETGNVARPAPSDADASAAPSTDPGAGPNDVRLEWTIAGQLAPIWIRLLLWS